MAYHTIKIPTKKIEIEFSTFFDGTMESIRLLSDINSVSSYANAKAICIDVFEMFDFETYPSDDGKTLYLEDLDYEKTPHVIDIVKRLKQVYGNDNVIMK